MVPSPYGVPILAGLAGALAAVLTGRERTRIDNFLIGGLFTAFAAYRDPRAAPVATIAVALVEGSVWGLTDRLVPLLKDRVIPGAEPATA